MGVAAMPFRLLASSPLLRRATQQEKRVPQLFHLFAHENLKHERKRQFSSFKSVCYVRRGWSGSGGQEVVRGAFSGRKQSK
jgi:hypothetical protein